MRGISGATVRPDFTRTEKLLGLAAGSVRQDNESPVVQEHKTAFPGHFVDNDDAARLIARLLDKGRLTVADLMPAIAEAIGRERLAGRDTRQLEALAASAHTIGCPTS